MLLLAVVVIKVVQECYVIRSKYILICIGDKGNLIIRQLQRWNWC